jgi:hypothetical protein
MISLLRGLSVGCSQVRPVLIWLDGVHLAEPMSSGAADVHQAARSRLAAETPGRN